MSAPLYKTTIIIWSEYNAEESVMDIAVLAREASTGDAYCSKQSCVRVEDPLTDPDWDGTEFFSKGEEEGG